MDDPAKRMWAVPDTLVLQAIPREASLSGADSASYSDLVQTPNGTVIKRERTLQTYQDGQRMVANLQQYYDALVACHVPVAALIRAECLDVGNGACMVVHEQQMIWGNSLGQIPSELRALRAQVTRDVVSIVLGMGHLPGQPNKLPVGIDAAMRNWGIDASTGQVVFLDLAPPLLPDESGLLFSGNDARASFYFNFMCGTVTGVIANVLMSALGFPRDPMNLEVSAQMLLQEFGTLTSISLPENLRVGVAESMVQIYTELEGIAAALPL